MPPTRMTPCPWDPTSWGIKDNAAGQAWYDSLLRQYATWGVDFLKVDCIADHPYKASEIRQIKLAIQHSGRDIVLSLSPGPTAIERHAEVADLAQMWRISNDIWDIWIGNSDFPIGIKNQFENAARWAEYTKPGNWPDADMLPVGELRPYPDVGPGTSPYAPDACRATDAAKPLGNGSQSSDHRRQSHLLDQDTLRLLGNADILKIDQTATASRQVLREGDLVIWTADLPGNQHALAAFNLGENAITFDRPLSDFFPSGPVRHKERVDRRAFACRSSLSTTIEPHASVVLMLDKK